MSIRYLVKDNDDFISHCKCEKGVVGHPGQLDCPWCGCGWLFSCMYCRKAFSFAKAVEMSTSWEVLAREDLFNYDAQEPTQQDIANRVEVMQEMMGYIELGKSYIYLDGFFIPKDEQDFEIEGWHSNHHFSRALQVIAQQGPSIVDDVLANPEYWTANETSQKGAINSSTKQHS